MAVLPTSIEKFRPSRSQKFHDNWLRLPATPPSFQFSATHLRTARQASAAVSNPLPSRLAADNSESTAPPEFALPNESAHTSLRLNASPYRRTALQVPT